MRVFFDTNVLVYAFDSSAPEKQNRALDLFNVLALKGDAVLSTQVLQEFFVVTTRKLAIPLSSERAEEIVGQFAQLPTVVIDPDLILQAIRVTRAHQVSFWDALLIAAAKFAGATELLTEDLQHGQTIEGVRIVNPFVEASAA
ncbi:MAG: PIN domain-containing protein [Burkholderiales bacterium]